MLARRSASISAGGRSLARPIDVLRLDDVGALVDLLQQRRVLGLAHRDFGLRARRRRRSPGGASRRGRTARRRSFFQASRSRSSRLSPVTVSVSAGRSASAVATLSRLSRALASSVATPGANSTRDSSPPPPPTADASSANGARHRLGDQVADRLPDHAAERELRVVDRAADRQVEVDDAVPVGEQRDRELDRQARGRALDLLAEGELVEDDLVARRQLAARLDDVGEVDAHLAALDAVARVLDRVRRQRRQLEVAHLRLQVERERLGERVDLAVDLERRRALDAAAQHQLGELRRLARRRRLGRERGEAAAQLAQVGVVVRLDEAVVVVDAAADDGDRSHRDDRPRASIADAGAARRAAPPATRRRGGRRRCAARRRRRGAPAPGRATSCRLSRPFSSRTTRAKKSLSAVSAMLSASRVAGRHRQVDAAQRQRLPVEQLATAPTLAHHRQRARPGGAIGGGTGGAEVVDGRVAAQRERWSRRRRAPSERRP